MRWSLGTAVAATLVALLARAGAATPDPVTAGCADRFTAVDARVDEAGLRDGGPRRVDGFPFLRVDRTLAAARPSSGSSAFGTWLRQARELDRAARRLELDNLGMHGPAQRALEACARRLMDAALAGSGTRARIAAAARVAPDYSLARRVLGLYPLASVGMLAGVERLRADFEADFRTPLAALPVRGRLVRFTPAAGESDPPAAVIALDALGLPAPTPTQLETLFDVHAPVFEVDVVSPDDRIGRVALGPDGAPHVIPSRPVIYRRTGATRLGDRWLLQLEYWAWFRARTASGPMDILAGHLDGLVWRVTLDARGAAIAYDSIHPCGCYHLVFPTPALARRDPPARYEEPLLAFPAPPGGAGRMVLRVAAGSHYLQRVYRDGAGHGIVHAVSDYDALRSLEAPDGSRRSLFDADGLVPTSRRPERWLLWMSGIESPGAMRQAGRHAVAFVGRRHFDDPDLLDRFYRRAAP